MGFFGRKKWEDEAAAAAEDADDFVELAGSSLPGPLKSKPQPPPPPPRSASEIGDDAESLRTEAAPVHSRNGEGHAVSKPPVVPTFSIDDAVQLIRQLPSRSLELVMQVVKRTLESVGVEVEQVIEAARAREESLAAQVSALRANMERLESDLATARKEIARLEAEEKEVEQVRERLMLALKLEGSLSGATMNPSSSAPRPATRTSVAPSENSSEKPGSDVKNSDGDPSAP